VQRPPAAIVVALVGSILLAAGCGGGGTGEGDTTTRSSDTIESLWRASGESVGAVAGTSDFQVGTNRVSFLVVDKQGRVMLPASLAKNAGIDREVVVAGVNDHLEIWDRAAWKRELAEVEGSAEDVAERLAAQGS